MVIQIGCKSHVRFIFLGSQAENLKAWVENDIREAGLGFLILRLSLCIAINNAADRQFWIAQQMDQGRATPRSRAKHGLCSFLLFCSLLPDASSSPCPYTTRGKERASEGEISPGGYCTPSPPAQETDGLCKGVSRRLWQGWNPQVYSRSRCGPDSGSCVHFNSGAPKTSFPRGGVSPHGRKRLLANL